MTTLLLIRHGASCANVEHRFVGQTDSPLSEWGKAQAERTADYIVANYAVDRVYASDLSRAYQTGKVIADRLGIEVIPDRRLREIHVGIWEDSCFAEMLAKGEPFFRLWKQDFGKIVCPEGESVAEVQKRMAEALEQIARENDGKTVAVASHAAAIRSVQCLYEGKTLEEMKDIPWVTNASVTVLQYADNRMKLVSVGYDAHLGDIRRELE